MKKLGVDPLRATGCFSLRVPRCTYDHAIGAMAVYFLPRARGLNEGHLELLPRPFKRSDIALKTPGLFQEDASPRRGTSRAEHDFAERHRPPIREMLANHRNN